MAALNLWKDVVGRYLLDRPILDKFIARDPDRMESVEGAQAQRFEGASPALLCLHGFTGAPLEVEIGCRVARELGLAGEAPLLPGHGTSSLDLANTRYLDWLDEARLAFDRLRRRGPVIIMGLSMGSLLATDLTLEAPGDVAGLVLLSNAFWLKAPYPAWALSLVDSLGFPDFRLKKHGPDLGDADARKTHLTYPAQPVSGGIEVLRAGERLRERLSEVRRPTLFLHGARDQVCPVDNAWKAAQRLGTTRQRVIIYPRSHHILTRDVERDQVHADILSFVKELVTEV